MANAFLWPGRGSAVPSPVPWQLTHPPSVPPSSPSDSESTWFPFTQVLRICQTGWFYSNMVTRKLGFGRDPKLLGGIWAIIPPCLFKNFNFTLMISRVPFSHLISK